MKVPFLDLGLPHRALRSEALAALAATYDATRFCLGEDVEAFERGFAQTLDYCGPDGRPAALGVSSGTAPLHMACMLAGFGPGDEVITSPFTFISSAWGINYTGATPVFADIEAGSYNLDPQTLEAAITPRTKGVIVVHLFGLPARMDEIMAIARKHGLFVIEDCAQAVGARYRGQPVGLFGDVGTFSFYPTKNLGACGEAGMLVSRDGGLLARARQMRVHGSSQRYSHEMIGGNWRMDGFQAAILNVKLPHLAGWTARRREIARRYLAELRLPEAVLPTVAADHGESVLHQFTLTHPRRDALRAHLADCGVGTDLIYPKPLHLQKCYAGLGYAAGALPVAERVAAQCLSLPIFPELSDEQVGHVIRSFNRFTG
ncbi:erythromycin biosynthesis sensory transduction protein eryC1 [Cephaloticoccus primus]|uniref:Erythromycin biosynthesis sensory transduction protein eryC1 n=1 Tax=Cephaloticoccus primus TaxID=1548207 RepID=A0A139SNK7_9BACT|nr:DegT/DnrJ/EryC1/StrS family aminotransferase [Cephaloticoccus primus]KXU36213.1 erythromycin biosynthesis sensory transduction protein eryC1 [Cephaloticoccus primus]